MRDDGHIPTSNWTEPADDDDTVLSDEAMEALVQMIVQAESSVMV